MKRLLIYSLVLTLLMLCLAGCGRNGSDFSFVSDDTVWGDGQESAETAAPKQTKKVKKEKKTAVSQAPEAKEDETVRKNGDVTIVEGPQDGSARTAIDTQFYSVSVPKDWEGNYTYELDYQPQGGYFLAFYELKDHQSFGGGTVMTIGLYPEGEDYSYLPDYKQYGTLTTPDGSYHIVILYPTDFQYTTENASVYEKMADQIPDVLDTIKASDGCTIRKA